MQNDNQFVILIDMYHGKSPEHGHNYRYNCNE